MLHVNSQRLTGKQNNNMYVNRILQLHLGVFFTRMLLSTTITH